MKKRLAMIVTMLMVTVSMAACGGKKDTTADKESVINTEATEAVAETESRQRKKWKRYRDRRAGNRALQSRRQPENWRVILPVQRILQRSHLTIIQANQIRATAIPAIRQAQAVLQQPEQRPVNAGGTTGSSNNTNTSDNSAAPAHVHTWVLHEGSGHYETQVVKEAWDEPIYSEVCLCNDCGADITSDPWGHIDTYHSDPDCKAGWHSGWSQTGTQHHDAETKQVYVQDVAPYAQCSGCGEIGPVGSGISIN